MKHRITLIAIILLLPLFLFAGGSKEEDVTVITWWHSNSGVLQEATDELVANFNETIGREQHLRVEPVYQGKANDVLVKLKAVSAENNLDSYPDLVQLDATGVIDVVNSDFILYTEDMASKAGDTLSFLQDNTRVSMTYKGKVIGMPFNSSVILYYYNKTLFDQLGLEPPETIDELIAIAPRLVDKDSRGNILRYAFTNIPTTYELTAFIGAQDGISYMTDKENGHIGTPTKTVFEENGTLARFLKKWKELYQTGGLENSSSNITSSFAAGKTASFLASSSNLTTVLGAVDGRFEVGVAPLFTINPGDKAGVNVGGGALFAIDKKDDQRSKAVWTFLRYATGKEAQFKWHRKTGYLPVNKETYTMAEYKTFTEENPLFKIAADELKASNPGIVGVWIPSGYQIYYSFMSNIKKMLEEDISVDKTVLTMQREIDGYLKDYNV
jgi:ABC-type sugar transport system, periplasmic component